MRSEDEDCFERPEEGQSCPVTAGKYSEKQGQRAETSLWNYYIQAKHTVKMLNICKWWLMFYQMLPKHIHTNFPSSLPIDSNAQAKVSICEMI